MDFNSLGILVGFLPAFAWLFFYLKEDPKPEPRYLIFITFISGIVAGLIAFLFEYVLNNYLEKVSLLPFSSNTTNALIIAVFVYYAFIEELSKFFTTKITVSYNKNFDEPVDAMIYMIVCSLGFATLENIGVLTNNKIILGSPLLMFQTASLRFIGATLLHSLTGAIIGYFWAMSIREFGYKKPLIFGILLATLLHTIFNFFIIIFGNSLITFTFLLIVGIFVLVDFEKLKYKKI